MAANREQHEAVECRYSKMWCPAGCRQLILRLECDSHVRDRCPERDAECRYVGWVPAREGDVHAVRARADTAMSL